MWDTFKQNNCSTVAGDVGCRVGEIRSDTTSPMHDHKSLAYSNCQWSTHSISKWTFRNLAIKTRRWPASAVPMRESCVSLWPPIIHNHTTIPLCPVPKCTIMDSGQQYAIIWPDAREVQLLGHSTHGVLGSNWNRFCAKGIYQDHRNRFLLRQVR